MMNSYRELMRLPPDEEFPEIAHVSRCHCASRNRTSFRCVRRPLMARATPNSEKSKVEGPRY
jgi:hypothetical protein